MYNRDKKRKKERKRERDESVVANDALLKFQ
jgi:hypothetical protein